METSTWKILSSINCNDKTEKKNGLTYLSWAWAWGIVKSNFPDANYEVVMFFDKPYLFDENLGYLIQTKVTINGETIPMQLPILDGANKSMNINEYEYNSSKWDNGKKVQIKKTVQKASMFDVNTTIMRCLTKNLAMFGLGHYIYAGEDLPIEVISEVEKNKEIELAKKLLDTAGTIENLNFLYNSLEPHLKIEEIINYCKKIKTKLTIKE